MFLLCFFYRCSKSSQHCALVLYYKFSLRRKSHLSLRLLPQTKKRCLQHSSLVVSSKGWVQGFFQWFAASAAFITKVAPWPTGQSKRWSAPADHSWLLKGRTKYNTAFLFSRMFGNITWYWLVLVTYFPVNSDCTLANYTLLKSGRKSRTGESNYYLLCLDENQ